MGAGQTLSEDKHIFRWCVDQASVSMIVVLASK